MKMMLLSLAVLFFSAQASQAQPTSMTLHPKQTIPLIGRQPGQEINESPWTVIISKDFRAPRLLGFPNTDYLTCGVKVPNGAAPEAAIYPHWILFSNRVVVTESFMKVDFIGDRGEPLTLLCGVGYDKSTGNFVSAPSVAEVTDFLSEYFEIQ